MSDQQSSDIAQNLTTALSQAAQQLRGSGLPEGLAAQMERLAEQVQQPCVVAIVGRVKAGKSSFINALLGEDLAKVGTTETTATINYFRYGQPDPQRPVRCYWRGGQITNEDRAFLDGLQGHDPETLRRAEGIAHLEYHLLNPYLQHVTLVDTPGTGAAVTEHQQRTDEFIGLHKRLRELHEHETRRIGSEADALIYLTGQVARSTDSDFLNAFRELTQGEARAFNAVGIMAKIDLYPDLLQRRTPMATKIAAQLKESVNTVVPVSAGIRRTLDQLLERNAAGMERLMRALRRIPPATLDKLLSSEEFWLELEPSNCPVTTKEREQLLDGIPWMVFTTIARTVGDAALNQREVAAHLADLSGFDLLHGVLDRHFFRRGRLLRSYRVVQDARRVLDTVKFEYLPDASRRLHQDRAKRNRFLEYVRRSKGELTTAWELERFIEEHYALPADLEPVVNALERNFSRIFHDLKEYNADFEALEQIEDHAELFRKEADELRALFGLYGLEPDKRLSTGRKTFAYVEQRQQAWREISLLDRYAVRRSVAHCAVRRYGLLMDHMDV